MPSHLAIIRALPSYQIPPMSFVCIDGIQGDFLIRPCTGATDLPFFVSQVGYDVAPNLIQSLASPQVISGYTPVAATAGEELALCSAGDVCPIQLGASASAGSLIGFNSSGQAVPVAAGSGSYFGGVATQQGLTGGVIDIYVVFGKA